MTTKSQHAPGNDYSQVEERFSDVFETHLNPWSAVVSFGNRAMKVDDDNIFTIRMRMPLQQAKAMALMLINSINTFEKETNTTIDLPREMVESLGIAEEW